MVAGELCFAVYAHGGPDDGGACEQCGAANLADCCLQLFGVLAVGPNHDVGVVAHCGDVVDAAQGHAVCCELFCDLLELGACLVGVGFCGACAGACEHGVQGVVQGFAFFAAAAVLVSCGVLNSVALGCAAVAVACVGVAALTCAVCAAVAVCCVIVRHCVFLSSARVRCAGGAASVAARFLNFFGLVTGWAELLAELLPPLRRLLGGCGFRGGDAFPVLCRVVDQLVHLLVGVFDG